MALSKEWYNAEFMDSEKETLHRAPSIEYSFYNAVKAQRLLYSEDGFLHNDPSGCRSAR